MEGSGDMSTYIKLENVSKSIKGNLILDKINLNLQKGKIYGFRGKNGSGKTMLFRSICGLINVTEGEIYIDNELLGRDISFPRSIGVLIEYPGFLATLTGFENLRYLASIKNIINDQQIKNAMESVGLNPEDRRKVRKYSLGMKQRLGIAQAIMEEPEIIILDEPTNALDEEGVELIYNLLIELKKKNKTILIANHDKEELERIAEKIFYVDKGKILDNADIGVRK